MIINSGARTDIPAFYSQWFMNRIREGYVLVRNPYYPFQVTKYLLNPNVVDVLAFCTKNPAPMLPHLEELKVFPQFWFVTITPYGKDIEPNVPDKHLVIDAFKELSRSVGVNAVSWRYDPIFISRKYTISYHIQAFSEMAHQLAGYTDQVVISFIDLYQKTKRNFPEARSVSQSEQAELAEAFVHAGKENGMTVRSCFEDPGLARFGVDASGRMTKAVLEQAIGGELAAPKGPGARPGCNCLLGNDIGAYNTCGHFCKYCYANYDRSTVMENMRRHDPDSPFLIGGSMEGDIVKDANQERWQTGQTSLFL